MPHPQTSHETSPEDADRSHPIVETRPASAWQFIARKARNAGSRRAIGRTLETLRTGGIAALLTHWRYAAHQQAIEDRYPQWMRDVEPALMQEVEVRFAALLASGDSSQLPIFSILVPARNTPVDLLHRCIESVLAQTADNWELCLVDDASETDSVAKIIQDEYVARLPERLHYARRTIRGNISLATNEAARLATGDFLILLDHDDELAPHAVAALTLAVLDNPAIDMLYTDEDKIEGESKRRFAPAFKPGLSRHHLMSNNYCCHATVIRRSMFYELGGLREGVEGAQDYDLWLRATDDTGAVACRIAHVPLILYHWRTHHDSTSGSRGAKPFADDAGRTVLNAAMHRRGMRTARIEPGPMPFTYHVQPSHWRTSAEHISIVRWSSSLWHAASFEDALKQLHGSGSLSASHVLFIDPAIDLTDTLKDGLVIEQLAQAAALPGAGMIGVRLIDPASGRNVSNGFVIGALSGQGEYRVRSADASTGLIDDPGYLWSNCIIRNVSLPDPRFVLVNIEEARAALNRVKPDELPTLPWWYRCALAVTWSGSRQHILLPFVTVPLWRADLHEHNVDDQAQHDWYRWIDDGLFNPHLADLCPAYGRPVSTLPRPSGASAGERLIEVNDGERSSDPCAASSA